MFARGMKVTSSIGGLMSAALLSKSRQKESGQQEESKLSKTTLCQEVSYDGVINEERKSFMHGINHLDIEHEEDVEACVDEFIDNLESFDVAGEVLKPNEQGRQQAQQEKLKAAVAKARDLCWCKMYEAGVPGMVVAIGVNGKTVWQHGFGYSDLENKLLAGTGCIMRVASISKPITMAVLAKLWEEGKVDMEESVYKYVPDWPRKNVDGVEVDITVRQLASHMSGIRHYQKKGEKEEQEFLLKETFNTTEESLDLFKNDELLSAPGTEFHYTTHGFTLLAKIIESVTGKPFDKYIQSQFKELGMKNTYLDQNDPIIYNRAKYYVRDEHHRLRNAPYVDNSYKWAGGGYLSSVGDLLKFGNAMMYSLQQPGNGVSPNTPKEVKEPSRSKPVDLPDVVPNSANPNTPDENDPSNPQTEDLNKAKTKTEELDVTKSNSEESTKIKSEVKTPDKIKASDDKSERIVENVVYQPGPYSNVNSSDSKIRLLPGFLKSSTMKELWKPQEGANLKWGGDDLGYGLGWAVRPKTKNYGFCQNDQFYASHTGGAIGASSVLLVYPHNSQTEGRPPRGVVVAILCNMQGVGLNKLAVDIASVFEGLELEKPAKVQKVYQC